MLMDPMGGIVMTNDGNAILREVRSPSSYTSIVNTVTQGAVNFFHPNCPTSSSPPPQIQVQHPAAKSIIEISRTQDEEVGDGTTSVIVLGEL